MDVCAGARWVLRNAKVGKESQEGEQQDQQALGNHQPLSLCTAYSVHGATLPWSLCNMPRCVLTSKAL